MKLGCSGLTVVCGVFSVLLLGCSGFASFFHRVLGVSPLKLRCWGRHCGCCDPSVLKLGCSGLTVVCGVFSVPLLGCSGSSQFSVGCWEPHP